jgi:hypothetical protein
MRASLIAIWIIHVLNFASSQKPPMALKAFKMLFWKVGTALERDLGCNRRHRMTQEEIRLSESGTRKKHWKRWGPYLSERAWGARCARTTAHMGTPGTICLTTMPVLASIAGAKTVWRESAIGGRRLRGPVERARCHPEGTYLRSNRQRNHGEDVKEYYFYLDSTPTHSYMKYLYKYPPGRSRIPS